MQKKNLFEIQEEYLLILDDLEEWMLNNPDSEGVIPEEFEERLNINRDEAASKIEGYYYVVKQLENEVELLAEEIARLKDRIDAKTKLAGNLKVRVAQAVKTFGIVETGKKSPALKTLKVKAVFISSPKVEITDAASVPSFYKRHDLVLKNMPEDLSEDIKELLAQQGLTPDDTLKISKEHILADVKAGIDTIPGIHYDSENGYVRFY